jgi:hypothetical protein
LFLAIEASARIGILTLSPTYIVDSAITPVVDNITRRSSLRIFDIQLSNNKEHSLELENEPEMF